MCIQTVCVSSCIVEKMASSEKAKSWAEATTKQLVRGKKIEDVEQKCLELCSDFLGGRWTTAKVDDLVVSRIGGGLSNQLYYVALKEHVKSIPNQPNELCEVTVKFYQPKIVSYYYSEANQRILDVLVGQLVSDLAIAPRLYGVFNGGVIQSYHKHEQLKPKHQTNPELMRKIAQSLAKIHAMKVPIPKRIDSFLDDMTERIESCFKKTNVSKLVQEFKLPQLTQKDLLEEFYQMRTMLKAISMPIVFCHGDFRNSNIMVTSDQVGQESILVCDFEEFYYGRRGSDMGSVFSNWNVEGYNVNTWRMPTDSELTNFCQAYLEQWDQQYPGYSSQAGNSVEDIVREAKISIMVNFMFWAAFLTDFEESGAEGVEYDLKSTWETIETIYKNYHQVKQHLIEVGSITAY